MRASAPRLRSRPTLTRLEPRDVPSAVPVATCPCGCGGQCVAGGWSGANYLPASYFLVAPATSAPEAVGANASSLAIARSYLTRHAGRFGLTATDLADLTVTSEYADRDTGIRHVYLRQHVGGLDVAFADLSVGIDATGRVISAGGGLVPGLAAAVGTGDRMGPLLPATEAVKRAGTALGLTMTGEPRFATTAAANGDMQVDFPSVSLDLIPARMQYVPTPDGRAALAWRLITRTPGGGWYELSIDASTGRVDALIDYGNDAGYQVVPVPNESPQDGGFTSLTDPANPVASPYGWHDTNGAAGAEFTDTRGNNVDAHLDRNANDVADADEGGGTRPSGGAALNFSGYTFNAAGDPTTTANQNAAQVNLFYVNNVAHDVHYAYGFTEAAGNFQVNNYGKGGTGNDAVQADAQDGSGTNNANFYTPADGSTPIMQQYLFTSTTPNRDSDLDNGVILHEYGHGVTNRLTGGPAVAGTLTAVQSRGMGEGWSDWYALMFLQRPTDVATDAVGIGTYVLGQSQTAGAGIRRKPYSFDLATAPTTFELYGTTGTTGYGQSKSTEYHNVGEAWCSALWDMNWLLIQKYGYDSNLSTGWTAAAGPGHAGNKLALRLVMDGLKLQPSNPSFTQARDAILAADTALTGGANALEIWTAFARRGLGKYALVASSGDTTMTVDYTVPPEVQGLVVTALTPGNGAVVTGKPVNYVLSVSQALDPATVDAADLTVNGLTASSVTYTAGATSLTFAFAADPVATQGVQAVAVAAGALQQLSDGKVNFAYTGTFRYDALPMQVTGTAPAAGATLALGATATLDFTLNEPVDPATVAAGDLAVTLGTVTGVSVLPGNQTVRFTVGNLATEGTLAASLAAAKITDVYGNPNLAYSTTFAVDAGTVPFTGPLASLSPVGSQAYRGSATGLVNAAGDADGFALTLDAGQALAVTVTPAAGLRPRITVLSPSNAVVADVTATATGQTILVPAAAIPTAGTYTLRVQGAASTTGTYTVQATLNAALEAEGVVSGATNNTAATAQSLLAATATNAIGGVASTRAAVVGSTDAAAPYAVSAPAYAYDDIAATGATVLASQDDAFAAITIPFGFTFYGNSYTTVYANTNGLITFGSGTDAYSNTNLTGSPAQPAIAVLWDDLVTAAAGVKWQVLGTAGSRRLVIQWENTAYYATGSSEALRFQAVLSEGTNLVRLNYANTVAGPTTSDDGKGATVGIKDGASAKALVSYNASSSSVGSNKSVLFTPGVSTADWYSFTAAAGQTASVIATGLTGGAVDVQLFASDGTTPLAAAAVGGTNVGKAALAVPLTGAGTYYAAVTGGAAVPYSLTVLTDATFDAEPNNTAAAAQPLGAARTAYGYAVGDSLTTSAFEAGAGGWAVDNSIRGTGANAGLWALTARRGSDPGHSASTSFHYGTDTGTYDTGAGNAGSITSPAFAVAANSSVSFNYVLQTEAAAGYDTANLQITTDNGGTWTTLLGRSTATALANTTTWTAAGASLSAYVGQTARLRFVFDTIDATSNGYEGWYVDDVVIGAPSNDDWYSVTLPAGQTSLSAETRTPADGPGEFGNALDPVVQVLNAAGTTVLATGVPLADGRNERALATGLTPGATYLVRVTGASGTAGEYAVAAATGTVTADTVAPTATATLAPVTTRKGTTYSFAVTLADNVAVSAGSVQGSDFTVTGPNGTSQPATLASLSPNADSATLTATLTVPAPGGTWDVTDNGTYTVGLTGSVTDTGGTAVKTGSLGTFAVQAPVAVQSVVTKLADGTTTSLTTTGQRSVIPNLVVTYDGLATGANVAAGYKLLNTGTNETVALTAATATVGGKTVATLTPTAPLPNGYYALTALGTAVGTANTLPTVVGLDGDDNGTAGGNYVLNFHRFAGDVTGDTAVDGDDLAQLAAAFNSVQGDPNYRAYLDLTGDGAVDGDDLAVFAQSFALGIL